MAEHPVMYRFLADLTRVAAAAVALVALVGIPAFGMEARSLLVLFVLLVPRATGGVPAPLDFAFGATLLVALWTSTVGWFETTPVGWLVPAVTTGVTAVVLYLILVRVKVLGEPIGAWRRMRLLAWTVLLGLVIGGVWETFRWFESHTQLGASLAGQLLVDAVGALVAGLLLVAQRAPGGFVIRETESRPSSPSGGGGAGPRRPAAGWRPVR